MVGAVGAGWTRGTGTTGVGIGLVGVVVRSPDGAIGLAGKDIGGAGRGVKAFWGSVTVCWGAGTFTGFATGIVVGTGAGFCGAI